jgi:hypothetical protein
VYLLVLIFRQLSSFFVVLNYAVFAGQLKVVPEMTYKLTFFEFVSIKVLLHPL